MRVKVPEDHQVSPFFLLFLFESVLVGVGILGYQHVLSQVTGNDSWMVVFIAGFCVQIILWMMFRLLERGGGDLITLHESLFGRWISGFLTLAAAGYFALSGLVVLRTYVEIVTVWMFPKMSYWMLSIIVAVVAYSFIAGGFRSIVGINFLSVIYTMPLLFTLFFPLKSADYYNLLPYFNHSAADMLKGVQQITLCYEGFEFLLMFYPFLKEPKQARKWGHYGIWTVIFLYELVLIVPQVYFNEEELNHIVWPSLALWEIVQLPFMERFEYIGVTIWLFTILPNLCLAIWSASRATKRLFGFNQRVTVLIMLIAIVIAGYFFKNRQLINQLDMFQSLIGFYLLYAYIPILFIYQTILQKVRKRHGQG